jgi:predicted RNA-binding protein associated with RNAse of E/G family
VEDDGQCLKTYTIIPESFSLPWSEEWQHEGRIPKGRVIGSVRKYLFYNQYFSIMEVCDTINELLGFYIDLSTPVRKVDGEYYLTDLILDLWIFPDQTYQILDEDEWRQAIQDGLVTKEIQGKVQKTVLWLEKEINAEKFPQQYIQA